MINYAHRGASEYAPENTLAAFYLGVEMGANGIETDVRLSLDGVPVLFHDSNMSCVSAHKGPVEGLTYAQLLELDLGSWKHPRYKSERIVTLEDFFKYCSGKDLEFAIELKGVGAEEKTLELVGRYCCAKNTTVTSFDLDKLKRTRRIDSEIRLGYLTKTVTDETYCELESYRIGEICPDGKLVTPELVAQAKARGFTVRAYGIRDVTMMEMCCEAGVDGMTVNFPDKLARWMETHKR